MLSALLSPSRCGPGLYPLWRLDRFQKHLVLLPQDTALRDQRHAREHGSLSPPTYLLL
jgi:hypothetical protein